MNPKTVAGLILLEVWAFFAIFPIGTAAEALSEEAVLVGAVRTSTILVAAAGVYIGARLIFAAGMLFFRGVDIVWEKVNCIHEDQTRV